MFLERLFRQAAFPGTGKPDSGRHIEVMFNFGDDYAQLNNGGPQMVKGSHLIGIHKQSLIISQTGKQHFFSIRFKLGGTYPFFKLPAYLFANGFYGLQDVLGNEYRLLEEQLYEAADDHRRVALAERFLLAKLHHTEEAYRFTQLCLRSLLATARPDIALTAHQFNTSYKTLERRFSQVLGINPKELLKINRFSNAVLAMYSGRHHSLTGIAYKCGYYDQSHFIREFRQLTGFSPRAFLQEQFTIVQVIQPALADRLSKLYNL